MNTEWEKYKVFLIEKLPSYAGKLLPPADWWEIDELKLKFGVDFPKDFTDIYSINNGESIPFEYGEWGSICGLQMYSIGDIRGHFVLDADFENWIPIFKDPEEDFYIGMDLFPEPNERHGQISTRHTRDETRNCLVASSLTSFFREVNSWIDSGYLYYSCTRETNNEISVHDIREYFEHTLEGLLEMVLVRKHLQ